ncbi:MAG: hypothetical protein L0Y64_22205, partial [Myxococcaceae bacterium]|nr:hypothetical protein [Myxococcaceae bacterium]
MRNVLLAGLAEDPDVHLGQLALAFGLSPEAVRQIRRLYESKGLPALLTRKRGGMEPKRRGAVEPRARKLFDAGHTVDEVHAALKKKVSRSTVGNIHKDWAREKREASTAASEAPPATLAPAPETLPLLGEVEETAVQTQASQVLLPPKSEPSAQQEGRPLARAPASTEMVQHVGTWLLVATVHALGLHQRALAAAGGRTSEWA